MGVAPLIHAAIVHFGDPAPTLRALEALLASRKVLVHAAVVDHGPGPGVALAQAVRDAGALYLAPGGNLGFAGGIRCGIEALRAQDGALGHCLFLNHDVVLEPDALGLLAARLEAAPSPAIVGPALLDGGAPGRVWNAGSAIEWPWARPRSLQQGADAAGLPREPFAAGFVCGCVLLAAREAVDRIGLPEASYFLYFEDADYGCRAQRAGVRVEVDPRARAVHRAGAAAALRPRLAAYCRARSRILFSRRWAPPGPGPRAARWLFALRRILRGGPDCRGAIDGLRSRGGPPPSDLFQGP